MTQRPIGRSGLATPPLVLGGNVFGWTADEATSFRLLDAFVSGGGTMVDTAQMYSDWVEGHGGGESEAVIGAWLADRGSRDKVQIATKASRRRGETGGFLSPERIRDGLDDSLQRLQSEYVDLFYAHFDDPDTPLADTLAAFDEVVRSGKVQAIAASNYSTERLAAALAISDERGYARFEAVQPQYSLLERGEFEGELQRLCEAESLGVLTYFSLASGYLTGKYRGAGDLDGASRGGMVKDYLNGTGPDILAVMDDIAEECGASHSRIALAWLMARPGVTAPIASATAVSHVDDMLAAMNLTLSDEQLARLNEVSAPA